MVDPVPALPEHLVRVGADSFALGPGLGELVEDCLVHVVRVLGVDELVRVLRVQDDLDVLLRCDRLHDVAQNHLLDLLLLLLRDLLRGSAPVVSLYLGCRARACGLPAVKANVEVLGYLLVLELLELDSGVTSRVRVLGALRGCLHRQVRLLIS